MKIYNVAGWALVLAYALACMYFAPPDIGPGTGLLDRRGLLRGVLVHRRRVPVLRDPHGDRPSRARLQGVVRQGHHGREQHLRRLREPGHLGQPAPAPPQVLRSSGRSQQARCRRLLADAVPLPDALQVRGRHGRRRDLQVLVIPARVEPGVLRGRTGVQLLAAVAARARLALRGGDLARVPRLRSVDQHDPELLDARPALRLPALPRRTRQRDEHRRVATGHRNLQRLPAEQPSPFPGLSALEPRGLGIRPRLHGRQGHEGFGPGACDEQGRYLAQGRPAELPRASKPPSSCA